jgi:hypothetical protein
MHDAVQAFTRLVPPPPPTADLPPWSEARREIGFSFPADFRDFVDVYGVGSVDDEFYVFAPSLKPAEHGRSAGFPGFLEWTTRGLGRSVADMRENALVLGNEESFPYPIYPEVGGLILFALNGNGDMCFWDSRAADPDDWTVVIYVQSARLWVPFDGCMADLLVAAVHRQLPEAPFLLGFNEEDHEWIRVATWAG